MFGGRVPEYHREAAGRPRYLGSEDDRRDLAAQVQPVGHTTSSIRLDLDDLSAAIDLIGVPWMMISEEPSAAVRHPGAARWLDLRRDAALRHLAPDAHRRVLESVGAASWRSSGPRRERVRGRGAEPKAAEPVPAQFAGVIEGEVACA